MVPLYLKLQLRHCSYISMKVKVSRRLRRRFLLSMEFVGLAKLGFVTSPVGILLALDTSQQQANNTHAHANNAILLQYQGNHR